MKTPLVVEVPVTTQKKVFKPGTHTTQSCCVNLTVDDPSFGPEKMIDIAFGRSIRAPSRQTADAAALRELAGVFNELADALDAQ